MPYKDPTAQREFQRKWAACRRAEFTAGQTCVDCGSGHDLELDHIDPAQKESHRIWTWSVARIRAEIAKCEWRCKACHVERHRLELPGCGVGGYLRGCRCAVCLVAKQRSDRRRSRDSNPGERLCRPPRNRSATAPDPDHLTQMELFDAA